MARFVQGLSFSWVVVVFAVLFSGCESLNKPTSASFASVTITGHKPATIGDTAMAVFREKGYSASALGKGAYLFVREGTRKETIAYDGLVAAQNGVSTMVQVRAQVVELNPDTYRLQCETFMIRRAGQALEEATRLSNLRSKPYQELLDEVARRLP